MNEVIKNTHAFVDILSMARSEAVQTWDEGTFQRAFKWAQYFEEVYTKLKSKPALAEKLTKYINNFNKTGKVYLGSLHLSFNELEYSKDILRNCLLQNPHINSSQFEHVLRLYGVKLGSSNNTGNLKVLEQDVGNLMNLKGTLTVLSQIRDKFHENLPNKPSGLSNISEPGDKEIKSFSLGYQCGCNHVHTSKNLALNSGGQLLFKYVLHFLDSPESSDSETMHEKLRIISLQEDGIHLITSCLLHIPEDCHSHFKADIVQQFVVNWLSDSLTSEHDHHFWKLPLTVLSMISYKYNSIRELYLSRLSSWANDLYPVLICQMSLKEKGMAPKNKVYVWRSRKEFSNFTAKMPHDDNEHSVDDSLDCLVLHFKCLTSGPEHIKEICFKRIEKHFSEHDCSEPADVKIMLQKENKLGVNIWWDLYCTITSG